MTNENKTKNNDSSEKSNRTGKGGKGGLSKDGNEERYGSPNETSHRRTAVSLNHWGEENIETEKRRREANNKRDTLSKGEKKLGRAKGTRGGIKKRGPEEFPLRATAKEKGGSTELGGKKVEIDVVDIEKTKIRRRCRNCVGKSECKTWGKKKKPGARRVMSPKGGRDLEGRPTFP